MSSLLGLFVALLPAAEPATCKQLIEATATHLHSDGYVPAVLELTDQRWVVRFQRNSMSSKYAIWVTTVPLETPKFKGMNTESTGTCLLNGSPTPYFRLTTSYPCLTCKNS